MQVYQKQLTCDLCSRTEIHEARPGTGNWERIYVRMESSLIKRRHAKSYANEAYYDICPACLDTCALLKQDTSLLKKLVGDAR